jgi:signal peptidase I
LPSLRPSSDPQLITDFMGYNSYEPRRSGSDAAVPPPNWVGDLILEAEVTVENGGSDLVFELSKGPDRFRARWDLNSGQCTLSRLSKAHTDTGPVSDEDFTELASKPTELKGKGTYRVRFANVDNRLTVWVDGDLPFENGVPYDAMPDYHGPYPNDLQPASIGARGANVRVHKLKLWRDTYYTLYPGKPDAKDLPVPQLDEGQGLPDRLAALQAMLSDPDKWSSLRQLDAKTMYVQPGHYLCLGDNSPESSDSRYWGTVPERLMLGRALLVYYPFGRAGRIK